MSAPARLNAEILRLAVPALGALLAEPTFLLVDAAIVGHLGTAQLAGVGIASVILGTLVGLSVFLAYGTTAQVARSLGAGDTARALSFGIAGLYLALIIGTAVLFIGWPLAPQLVGWFGGGPAETGFGITFLRWSLLGMPAMLAVLAATGVLRGLQDTRTPLLVAVLGAIVNIGLNLLLVNVVKLGVAGSAIGTVTARRAHPRCRPDRPAAVLPDAHAARRHHPDHRRGRPPGSGRACGKPGRHLYLELPGARPGRAGHRRAGAHRKSARGG